MTNLRLSIFVGFRPKYTDVQLEIVQTHAHIVKE